MSSPRTSIFSLIRFEIGQNWDVHYLKSKFLAGWIKSIILGPWWIMIYAQLILKLRKKFSLSYFILHVWILNVSLSFSCLKPCDYTDHNETSHLHVLILYVRLNFSYALSRNHIECNETLYLHELILRVLSKNPLLLPCTHSVHKVI